MAATKLSHVGGSEEVGCSVPIHESSLGKARDWHAMVKWYDRKGIAGVGMRWE